MPETLIDILIADDNEDDVLLLRKAFKEAKLLNVVAAVSDGDEALAYLRRQGKHKDARTPGLVLLDINMPRLDGFAALQAIKADPALKHLPVVMLTTSKQEGDIYRSYCEGACTFITKPVGLADFQEAVRGFELYWAVVACLPEGKR